MSKRILVVDDEPAIAEVLADLFEDERYVVEIANNGAEGLLCADRNVPDLVLLDVMMPVLDGPGMLQAMRRSQRLARVPVLFMSAARPSLEGLDYAGFVEKPFDMDALLVLVARLIRQ